MTEMEARMWTARLTRVWGEPSKQRKPNFTWTVPGGCIRAKTHATYTSFHLDLSGLSLYASTGGVLIGGGEPSQGAAHWASEQHEALKREWTPLFRRGCWLSGCAIEATTHEKTEWMRDLTKEEIEAWNLEV